MGMVTSHRMPSTPAPCLPEPVDPAEPPLPSAARNDPARTDPAPRIWLLAGGRAGDRAQLVTLARALGAPFEERRLTFNRLRAVPNVVLGASRLTVDRRRSDDLAPPWPDLVLASGRRSAPVARWIRARSQGRSRLVHVGRPWLPVKHFDLVITTPQYGLPDASNVLHNTLTLNRPAADDLDSAARAWAPRFAALPRPWTALLIGGDARPYELDADSAERLARAASRLAASRGGSLLVTTSPRTGMAQVRRLESAISVPCHVHRIDPAADAENPYLAYLALADSFVVTGDSASMLSEACATGKPVFIFALTERPDLRLRLVRWFHGLAKGASRRPTLARCYDTLVDVGLIGSVRAMPRFHQALIEQGYAARLGEDAAGSGPPGGDDLARAVGRVRALLGET